MRPFLLFAILLLAAGCTEDPAAVPVLTESTHNHYHIHAADASHDHDHNGAKLGHNHTHEH